MRKIVSKMSWASLLALAFVLGCAMENEGAPADEADPEEPMLSETEQGVYESCAARGMTTRPEECSQSGFNCSLPTCSPRDGRNRIWNDRRNTERWPLWSEATVFDGKWNGRAVTSGAATGNPWDGGGVKVNYGQKRMALLNGAWHLMVYVLGAPTPQGSMSGWIYVGHFYDRDLLEQMPTVTPKIPSGGVTSYHTVRGGNMGYHVWCGGDDGEGLVQHYLTRNGSHVNLLYATPSLGGVSDDTFPIGSTFERLYGPGTVTVPYGWCDGNTLRRVGDMSFIYGRIWGTHEYRHGWIAQWAL